MSDFNQVPALTLADYDGHYGDRHLLHDVVEKWARETPDAVALIDADRNRRLTWAEFNAAVRGMARQLLQAGFRKGDRLASVLSLSSEHLVLEFACFKLGVVFVPLDLRLSPAELLRGLGLVQAAGFVFARTPSMSDPAALCAEIRALGPLKLLAEMAAPADCAPGAVSFPAMLAEAVALSGRGAQKVEEQAAVGENDAALVIFTTGSTGSPKAALLSHRNVTCQAMCISQVLLRSGGGEFVTLVNLPPSHVGCQTELLMGTLFGGGTAVLLPVFDPLRSMKAIADFKVTVLGQIPAMFQFEWRLKEYEAMDRSSLGFVAYGGQQVSPEFLERMSTMAPIVGTGLGLTETAGFCTYIRRRSGQEGECATNLGVSMPVYPMSIREAMRPDGSAGEELPEGKLGHICFRGPQTFLGYLNDPTATAATISTDGFVYTGDMGLMDAGGLHLAGRAKWVIKPGGYQVFPGDVEQHFMTLDGVGNCAVVGVPHAMLSEAIVVFVEPKPGAAISAALLERHARALASYMRPRHYVLLEPGQMPLNRVAKPDHIALLQRAKEIRD